MSTTEDHLSSTQKISANQPGKVTEQTEGISSHRSAGSQIGNTLFWCLWGPSLSQALAAVTVRLLSAHHKAIAKNTPEPSTSVCTEVSARSPLSVMTLRNINVNDSISALKYLLLSMGHTKSVGYMPLSNLT